MTVTSTGALDILEPDDFGSFSIRFDSVREAATLPEAVRLVGSHDAEIGMGAVEDLLGVSDDPVRQAALIAMIEKARPIGWINDRTNAIRAHVIWSAGTDAGAGVTQ
ncbi:hypothetical protein [Pukyongiella litopenaei]|uniref:Uncharacterized protein n=1 Tax=Pukyongiella litopenaei TaxID=2605946 RepID=A0A5C2H2G1_9RHOB|nr:hypothetical protein [Pukyongiella litopenaei]QEP30648.1 hypothetical protein C6Y53_20840 [Pukyongiella litopenaei]